MSPRWHFGSPRIPVRSLALSGGALAVPVVAQLALAEAAGDHELLLWMMAVVPAFLLAYYRGWRGAATALAAGMAVLSVTQAVLIFLGHGVEDTLLLFGVVVAFIVLSLVGGWLMEKLHEERERAELLALTDDLTGLPNRRHAQMWLEPVFQRAHGDHDLGVLFFDLDRFKEYNDRFGHGGGDEALVAFAEILSRHTPADGFSCRYGGEEFMTVLPGAGPMEAVAMAVSVRESLRLRAKLPERLTVSVGIACHERAMTDRADLLAAADAALYEAKASGRDAIRVHGIEVEPAELTSVPGI